MEEERCYDCCHVRIVKYEQTDNGTLVGFETVCLKNNAVRYDEGTSDIQGTPEEHATDVWQKVSKLVSEWNQTIAEPVPSIIGKSFDPSSLQVQP